MEAACGVKLEFAVDELHILSNSSNTPEEAMLKHDVSSTLPELQQSIVKEELAATEVVVMPDWVFETETVDWVGLSPFRLVTDFSSQLA